ncbi:MAG: tyrosine-type recombinase/integrase [Acidobacteriota bacterium]|nr:tyrosine-type recombinase/integrase [Acidobacteriota bacterium]
MLQIYRRHYPPCTHRSRRYRRCNCPLWVQGTLRGEWVKKSLGLRSWDAAQDIVRGWEASGEIGVIRAQAPTLPEAIDRYLADCEARDLKEPSLKKYRLFLRGQLLPWCEKTGRRRLRQLDVQALREFRESWTYAPTTKAKTLEALRAFFRFAADAGWIVSNPARALKPPRLAPKPTLPFSEAEIKRLLDACKRFKGNGDRLYALVLLLRHSGLRISDAVALTRDRLVGDKVFLYTQKTGVPVSVPLPKKVTTALRKLPGKPHLFWSGDAKPKSAIEDVRRSFGLLAKLAEVEHAHFHRFRDSFAVSLLVRGVSVENVAVLLGNTPAIVLKHYSPWVKERQRQLDAAVRKTWRGK